MGKYKQKKWDIYPNLCTITINVKKKIIGLELLKNLAICYLKKNTYLNRYLKIGSKTIKHVQQEY